MPWVRCSGLEGRHFRYYCLVHFRCYFDVCDGFFTNYNWKEQHLVRTAQMAGDRRRDVYVGVDVFGRGDVVSSGFETDKVGRSWGKQEDSPWRCPWPQLALPVCTVYSSYIPVAKSLAIRCCWPLQREGPCLGGREAQPSEIQLLVSL